MNDDVMPYAYYPDPVEGNAVGYDRLMAHAADNEFVAVIDIPGREAIYYAHLEVLPHSPLLKVECEGERQRAMLRCMVAIGKRVDEALKE